MTTWNKKFVEHIENDIARLSIAFTWDLPEAYSRTIWLKAEGYHVIAGGPAVMLMPKYLSDVAEIGTDWPDAVSRHNPDATFTSRGCIRKCKFCPVWRIEGTIKELNDWPVRPVICDNNLLACSIKHFDSVIDKLKPLKDVDFQGLDARLLTGHHAKRLAELDCRVLRLGFDHIKAEQWFLSAYEKLRKAGFAKQRIRAYILIGYRDTPQDALYRLQLVRDLGLLPNPMRYNPLDTLVRDNYVDENWTERELHRYMRYWANLRYFGAIPFADWRG